MAKRLEFPTIDWIGQCGAAALAVPKETRQKFIDLMWAGKSVGESMKEVDISFEAANGIMLMNIQDMKTLRREAL